MSFIDNMKLTQETQENEPITDERTPEEIEFARHLDEAEAEAEYEISKIPVDYEEGNWIKDYARFICSRVKEVPIEQAEIYSAAVLCAITEKKLIVQTIIGDLYPNINFVVIGSSGFTKTLVPKYYIEPLIQEYKMLTEGKKDLLIPSRFSIEAQINWLSKQSTGILIRDEFSGLWKSTKGSDYLAELLEFLSEVYDGTVEKRYTFKHELNEVRDINVSLITNTTPDFFNLVSYDSFFGQGLGNRCIFEYIELSEPQKVDKTFFYQSNPHERKEKQTLFTVRLKAIADKLISLAQPLIVQTIFKSMVDFKNDMELKAYQLSLAGDNTSASFYKRQTEIALKLSAIHALSRLEYTDLSIFESAEYQLPIIEVDANWGIKIARRNILMYEKIKTMWKIKMKIETPISVEKYQLLLMSILKDNNNSMGTSELCQKSKLNFPRYKETLLTLQHQGKVVLEPSNGKIFVKVKNEQTFK